MLSVTISFKDSAIVGPLDYQGVYEFLMSQCEVDLLREQSQPGDMGGDGEPKGVLAKLLDTEALLELIKSLWHRFVGTKDVLKLRVTDVLGHEIVLEIDVHKGSLSSVLQEAEESIKRLRAG